MTVLNFPPTAGEPTDGSFTYEENGVIYSWDGVKWTAEGDAAFWSRSNTTLNPANAGDNVTTTGTGTFGALTGRTTVPAVGEVGETLVNNTDLASVSLTHNTDFNLSLSSPLTITPGVWRVDASVRLYNVPGEAGNLGTGYKIPFSIGNINTTGGSVFSLGCPSDNILYTTSDATISSAAASIVLSTDTSVDVPSLIFNAKIYSPGDVGGGSWNNRIIVRVSAVRIA